MYTDRDYEVVIIWRPRYGRQALPDTMTSLTFKEAERIAEIYRRKSHCLSSEIRLAKEV